MEWIKKGLIYKPQKKHLWMQTHAQVPVADKVDEERIRIYFGTRDNEKRTLTTYIEVEADNPQNILYEHNKPILPLGDVGCFDDSGVMPSCIVNHKGIKYFYYLGWNAGLTARYRVADGLGISEDNGKTFKKYSRGPIMDRNIIDPISTSIQSIIIENNIWRSWYMSYTEWKIINGVSEPFYHIKYAESNDGIHWSAKDIICIDFEDENEGGISVPSVIKDNGLYKMWYSVRNGSDYRKNTEKSYRIGYAESVDGIKWIRKDKDVGIDVSEEGWDIEMLAYPNVYRHKNKLFMLYNGNGFGQSGFGYAVLDEK